MSRGAHFTLVNGEECSALSISDRGLAYGDGLFETMRMLKGGDIPLFDLHSKRFYEGLCQLKFSNPDTLLEDFNKAVSVCQKKVSGDVLVKVILTRGSGGRGYSVPEYQEPSLLAQVFDMPQWPSEHSVDGVAARLCEHRLSSQPALAGVKHLNRLDQVLAASELEDEAEGLVCDQSGNLVEGTKSNILVFMDDRVITPELSDCGVNGVLRQYMLENSELLGFDVAEERFPIEQVGNAKGFAFINSVFGIWPANQIGNQMFPIDVRVEKIRKVLHSELAFS